MLTLGASNGTGNFSGTIVNSSGSLAVVKIGTGTETFSAANTYSGGTTISGGMLVLNSTALALGATNGSLTVNGGELDIHGLNPTVGQVTLAGGTIADLAGGGTLSGSNFAVQSGNVSAVIGGVSSALSKTTSGTVYLLKANTYGGGTTIAAGLLQLGNNNALGTGGLAMSGGTLDLAGYSPTPGSLSGTGGLITSSSSGAASNSTLTVNQAVNTTFGGQIGDGAYTIALVKGRGGMLTLTGSNGYSGGTNVLLGTLRVGNSAALGSGGLAVNGGTLDLAGYSIMAPSFSGGGSYVTNSGTATAVLTVSQSIATAFNGTLSDGAGKLALVKSGSGLLTLGPGPSNNNYSGGTTVSSGTLQLNAANALGNGGLTVNGGVVDLNGNNLVQGTNSVASLSGSAGTITDNSGNYWTKLDVSQSASTTFGGALQAGTGSNNCQIILEKYGAGSLTLTGGNDATRTTRVVGGTLQIGPTAVLNTYQLFANDTDQGGNYSGNGVLAINGSVAVTGQWAMETNSVLSGTGTVNVTNSSGLNYSSAAASTFNGSIIANGGNAGVSVNGGQLTLAGANTYRGGTNVNGGLLQLANADALGTGALAANGGTLDLAGYSITVPSFSGAAGTVTNNGGSLATLTVNQSGDSTFSGTIAGNTALTITGPGGSSFEESHGSATALILTGANTSSGTMTLNNTAGNTIPSLSLLGQWSGPVVIKSGLLALGGTGTIANNVTMSGGAIDDLGGSPLIAGNLTVSGGTATWDTYGTTVAGGVTVLQGGQFNVGAGSSLNTPTVTVNGGVLTTLGADVLSATTAVTVSGGTLDVSGNAQQIQSLSVGNSGTLNLGVGNLLSVSGSAGFGGTLNVVGMSGGSAELVAYGSYSASFGALTGPGMNNYLLSYGTSELDALHRAVIGGGLTATPALGTIIKGQSTAFTVALANTAPLGGEALNYSGTAGANVLGSLSGTLAAGQSGAISGFTFSTASIGPSQTGSFTIGDANSTGPQSGAVTVNVLANRAVTATAIAGLRVMQGQAAGGISTLATSDPGNGDLTAASNTAFTVYNPANGNSVGLFGTTSGGTIGASVTASGPLGTGTIGTVALSASGGQGLPGETDTAPSVTISGNIVTNRVVTATPIALGRFMASQSVGGTSALLTTGGDDSYTRVTVNGTLFNSATSTSTYTLGAGTYAAGRRQRRRCCRPPARTLRARTRSMLPSTTAATPC